MKTKLEWLRDFGKAAEAMQTHSQDLQWKAIPHLIACSAYPSSCFHLQHTSRLTLMKHTISELLSDGSALPSFNPHYMPSKQQTSDSSVRRTWNMNIYNISCSASRDRDLCDNMPHPWRDMVEEVEEEWLLPHHLYHSEQEEDAAPTCVLDLFYLVIMFSL